MGTFIPQRLWISVGSGTLISTFRKVVGDSVELRGINVNVLPKSDPRMISAGNMARTKITEAREFFHEPAKNLPPLPSNLFYDAKLWSFLLQESKEGDIWWNVAR